LEPRFDADERRIEFDLPGTVSYTLPFFGRMQGIE
jgi:hypothetical protein